MYYLRFVLKISVKSEQENTIYYEFESDDEQLTIHVPEPLTYSNATHFRVLFDIIDDMKSFKVLILDFSKQKEFDTYLIVFRNSLAQFCLERNIDFRIEHSNDDIESVISLMQTTPTLAVENLQDKSQIYLYFQQVGSIVIKVFQDVYNFISFFGELIQKLLKLIIRPLSIRWQDMPLHFTQSGVMALPITIMIVFLLGLITGYQGALQLKQFGADMFIANLVGISLSRELSPLMVAILVAGRSGSAFAAELGTMKVSEEIDALTTMGFDKFEFLVLPRVLSVTLAMPFLVIICNVVGIAGGLVAAITTLDITTAGYIGRLEMALSLWDIGTGLIKSLVFGFLIAALGCYKGINVKGGADAVGRYTTSSVVAGVFLIILSDAIFTFIFQSIGI